MKCRAVAIGGTRFVESAERIARVDDALDLVSACAEHGSRSVLVDDGSLPEAFFELRSRFAGEFIQKLQNYGLRIAAVIRPDSGHGEKFEAFIAEARHGRQFRAFASREEAQIWLEAE